MCRFGTDRRNQWMYTAPGFWVSRRRLRPGAAGTAANCGPGGALPARGRGTAWRRRLVAPVRPLFDECFLLCPQRELWLSSEISWIKHAYGVPTRYRRWY